METKQFQNLLESILNLNEDHMKGKTVIVNGKRGVVGKEVSQDGQTEGDEFYRVKFEDGTTKNIPARDMEIAGDTKNKKQPGENEAEDIVKESAELTEKKKKKGKHDCATHVEHTQYGEGTCIHSKHATPDENGQIAWYDVMFEHGVEKGVPTDSLKILVSEMHGDHANEEVDTLHELEKKTYKSYIKKAGDSIERSGYEAGRAGQRYKDAQKRIDTAAPNPTRRNVRQLAMRARNTAVQDYRDAQRTTKKRQSGIKRAVDRLSSRNEDYQCPKELEKNNMKGAGVGIPAINNNVFGTNGFKSNKKNAIKEAVKIKLNPETKIGHKITAVGPGGRTNVTNRENMPGEPNVRSSKK